MKKITLNLFLMLALTLTGLTTIAQTKFLVDFNFNSGTTYQSSPNWNNWNAPIAVDANIPLVTDAGASSSLVLKLTSAYGGANELGVATPGSGFAYPGTAMMDAIYNSGTTPTTFELSGLNATKVYNFEFFGSRKDVTNDRTTNYTCAGTNTVTASSNSASNANVLALVNDVTPNAEGKIIISFVKGATNAANFAYLNFFTVTEITPVLPQVLLSAEVGSAVEGEFLHVDALKMHVMANGDGLQSVNDFEVVDNPNISGINTSAKVVKFVRRTGPNTNPDIKPWSGFWTDVIDETLRPDMTVNKYVHVKILKQQATPQKFKLEGGTTTPSWFELNSTNTYTTVGQWQDLVFYFPAANSTYQRVGLMPDFEDPLVAGADRIIYFDDITINNSPTPITAATESYLTGRVSLYPNPANNSLFIDSMEDLNSVSIFSLDGRQVATFNKVVEGTNNLNIENLSKGIYMVHFTAKNGATLTQKLIKE